MMELFAKIFNGLQFLVVNFFRQSSTRDIWLLQVSKRENLVNSLSGSLAGLSWAEWFYKLDGSSSRVV